MACALVQKVLCVGVRAEPLVSDVGTSCLTGRVGGGMIREWEGHTRTLAAVCVVSLGLRR